MGSNPVCLMFLQRKEIQTQIGIQGECREDEGDYLKAKGDTCNRFLPYSSQKAPTPDDTLILDM